MVFALISLGCPKNQVDADVMCHALLERGHITTADLSEADAIIVNTCGFIESAKQEAIDSILEACSYKEQKPELKVVVTGCLAQRYQHEIVKEIPEVDAVVGLGSEPGSGGPGFDVDVDDWPLWALAPTRPSAPFWSG